MTRNTVLMERPLVSRAPEPLLREALGAALRTFRTKQGITLRELAESARVSAGYISELERGRKEVSSELLASVAHALNTSVANIVIEAAGTMAISGAAGAPDALVAN